MFVNIKFGPPFRKIFGMEKVEFEMPFAEKPTVNEILNSLYNDYPEFYEKLREDNYLREGKIKAVILINRELSLFEDVVEDGAEIKILIPMCGG
ncbi:MAG: MoaD/ThiS family protein [Bacillota bacterium]